MKLMPDTYRPATLGSALDLINPLFWWETIARTAASSPAPAQPAPSVLSRVSSEIVAPDLFFWTLLAAAGAGVVIYTRTKKKGRRR